MANSMGDFFVFGRRIAYFEDWAEEFHAMTLHVNASQKDIAVATQPLLESLIELLRAKPSLVVGQALQGKEWAAHLQAVLRPEDSELKAKFNAAYFGTTAKKFEDLITRRLCLVKTMIKKTKVTQYSFSDPDRIPGAAQGKSHAISIQEVAESPLADGDRLVTFAEFQACAGA